MLCKRRLNVLSDLTLSQISQTLAHCYFWIWPLCKIKGSKIPLEYGWKPRLWMWICNNQISDCDTKTPPGEHLCWGFPSRRCGWSCPRISDCQLSTQLLLHKNMQNNLGWFQCHFWEFLCWQPQILDAECWIHCGSIRRMLGTAQWGAGESWWLKMTKSYLFLGLLSLFQLLWEGSYIAVLNPFSPVASKQQMFESCRLFRQFLPNS